MRLAHTVCWQFMVQFYLIGFLGAIHTYLKVACFSTDKESLALRNDWLSIDLTWEDVAQRVAREITVGF